MKLFLFFLLLLLTTVSCSQTDKIDLCKNVVCENNGVCNEGFCDCKDGFKGKSCEININDCPAVNPCQNDGICIDEINKYHCECKEGFDGENCEININDCPAINPCQNDGICIDEVNKYHCECKEGFDGENCEININDCPAVNPCQNDGICIDEVNKYHCECKEGFEGENCEINICGNGNIDNQEQCDDGNNENNDGCSSDCKIEVSTVFSVPESRDILNKVKEYIYMATPGSKIRMSYYLLGEASILDSLKVAKNRGVDIEIIVDGKNRNSTNATILEQADEICLDNTADCVYVCKMNNDSDDGWGSCLGTYNDGTYKGINHNKFILFEELSNGLKNVVFQSSSNLYDNSVKRFQDLVIIPYDTVLYNAYLTHFMAMKSEDADNYSFTIQKGISGVEAYFFPKKEGSDPIIDILDEIDCSENGKINIAIAYFYDYGRDTIASKLSDLSDSGCDVKVITGIEWGDGSYLSPGFNVIENLKGSLLKAENAIHCKFMLVDAKMNGLRKKIVVTGSHNYTFSALRQNDETFIRMENDRIYNDYLNFWTRIKDYSSVSSRNRARKVDLHHIADGLKKHYAIYGSYTQPENSESDCSTGDNGSECGNGDDWDENSDLRDLVAEDILWRLPVDPVNDSEYHYTYEPWNGGASQDNHHKGWKYSLCASKMEESNDGYCIRRELGE